MPPHANAKLQEKSQLRFQGVLVNTMGNQHINGVETSPAESPPPLYIVGDVFPRTRAIRLEQAENLTQAAMFSSALGFPLEYHMTISAKGWGYKQHKALLRKIAEWQRYHVGKALFVWAREGQGSHHSHIMLYLPRHKASGFRSLARKWIKALLGVDALPKGTVETTRINSWGDAAYQIGMRVRYLLKGTDDETRLVFGIMKRDSSTVLGKRCGVSQALGVAARKKAGAPLPSGLRRPSPEMLEAARLRDEWRKRKKEVALVEGAKHGTSFPSRFDAA